MKKNKNINSLIISLLSQKPVAFNPILSRITGSVKAGLFLSQLLYWYEKGENKEWIYKTIEEIEEETTLSRDEQDNAIKKLKKLEIIEVKLMGVPAKRHFKINIDKIISLCKTHKQVCGKPANWIAENPQTITENTTENTTDTIILHSKSDAFAGNVVNDLIYSFKDVNPFYEKLFKNKTEREAAAALLKSLGEEKAFKLVNELPKINSYPYMPISTKPSELLRNLPKIKARMEQIKNEKVAKNKNKVAFI